MIRIGDPRPFHPPPPKPPRVEPVDPATTPAPLHRRRLPASPPDKKKK